MVSCQTVSTYSFSISKSRLGSINYHSYWIPTSNLIIKTQLITNFKNDNKIFYNLDFNLKLNSKNNFGISINSLRFDNQFGNIRWNSYFLSHKFNFKGFMFNLMLDYNVNQNFSFTTVSHYFQKRIFKSFDIGLGLNITHIDTFLFKPYFGIVYNL